MYLADIEKMKKWRFLMIFGDFLAIFSFFQYRSDTFGTLHILTKSLKMHKSKCVRQAMN